MDIDLYLKTLIKDSLEWKETPDAIFCEGALSLTKNEDKIKTLQNTYTLASKQLFLPSRVSFIIKYDMMADEIPREDRIKLMSSWNAKQILMYENLIVSEIGVNALEKVLDSELKLAEKPKTASEVLYHRTRSFAYSFIFFLKDEFLSLMSPESLQYACECSLGAVLMDDVDDIEEDLQAESPTIFTFDQNLSEKITKAMNIIHFLNQRPRLPNSLDILSLSFKSLCEDLENLNGDIFLNIFLCMAFARCYEKENNLSKSLYIFDTRTYLKALALPTKKTWRKGN